MEAREPAFNIPTIVVTIAAFLIGVHLIMNFLDTRLYVNAMMAFGFLPFRYGPAGASLPGGTAAQYWSPITYSFLHGGWMHLLVNILWMASFGSAVARRFGGSRFMVIFIGGAIAGALAHYIALPSDTSIMIGASAAVSAMTAAAARFAFAPGGPLSRHNSGDAYYRLPAPSIRETLLNPRALIFIVVWFAINLAFAFQDAPIAGMHAGIAWQAHIGGFLAGFFMFSICDSRPRDRDSTSSWR